MSDKHILSENDIRIPPELGVAKALSIDPDDIEKQVYSMQIRILRCCNCKRLISWNDYYRRTSCPKCGFVWKDKTLRTDWEIRLF